MACLGGLVATFLRLLRQKGSLVVSCGAPVLLLALQMLLLLPEEELLQCSSCQGRRDLSPLIPQASIKWNSNEHSYPF